jgi:hypothetical protein
MRFYFLIMVKDAPDRDASIAAESSVADAFSPVRSWDLGNFAFYPVMQTVRQKSGSRTIRTRESTNVRRSNDGTEEVFS